MGGQDEKFSLEIAKGQFHFFVQGGMLEFERQEMGEDGKKIVFEKTCFLLTWAEQADYEEEK